MNWEKKQFFLHSNLHKITLKIKFEKLAEQQQQLLKETDKTKNKTKKVYYYTKGIFVGLQKSYEELLKQRLQAHYHQLTLLSLKHFYH